MLRPTAMPAAGLMMTYTPMAAIAKASMEAIRRPAVLKRPMARSSSCATCCRHTRLTAPNVCENDYLATTIRQREWRF